MEKMNRIVALSLVFAGLLAPLAVSAGLPGVGSLDKLKEQAKAVLGPEQVKSYMEPYFAIQKALAGDDLAGAKDGASQLKALIESGDKVQAAKVLLNASVSLVDSADLATARVAFNSLSEGLIVAAKTSGVQMDDVYVATCPMAADGESASWLQEGATVANPYLGTAMSTCGSVVPLNDKAGK